MNLDLKYTYLLAVAALSLPSCINEDVSKCPPLSMVFDVEERLYDKDQEFPYDDPNKDIVEFGRLIPTLYCKLQDYNTGEVVREMPIEAVNDNSTTHTVVFDDELPYGKYILTAWGGIDNESALGNGANTLDLSDISHEMYVTCDTIDYQYNNDCASGHFKKVNGLVVIETLWETFPNGIDSSDKTFYGVRSEVNSNLQYDNTQDIEIHKSWDVAQKIVSQTVLPPSKAENGTKLHIRYYKSTEPESPGIVPEDVYLTVRRNAITYLRYYFDPYVDKVIISEFVNGQWQEIHEMNVD